MSKGTLIFIALHTIKNFLKLHVCTITLGPPAITILEKSIEREKNA